MLAARVVESIRILRGLMALVFTRGLTSFLLSSRIRSSPNRWFNLMRVVASGHRIHQVQVTEVPPGEALTDLGLHFFITEAPAELQEHHAEVNIDRSSRPAHRRIEYLLEGLAELPFEEQLIDSLQLVSQAEQSRINEAVTKTQSLIIVASHRNGLQRLLCYSTLEISKSSFGLLQ